MTTTTTTTKNYTKEQEAQMMAAYSLEPTRTTVSELATALGKTEKSIIAKLGTLGVYVKANKPVTNEGDLVLVTTYSDDGIGTAESFSRRYWRYN